MLYFSIQKASPRCDEKGLRSGGCEMTILSSDHARHARIVSILAEAIQGFSADI